MFLWSITNGITESSNEELPNGPHRIDYKKHIKSFNMSMKDTDTLIWLLSSGESWESILKFFDFPFGSDIYMRINKTLGMGDVFSI